MNELKQLRYPDQPKRASLHERHVPTRNTIRLWDATSRTEIHSITGHSPNENAWRHLEWLLPPEGDNPYPTPVPGNYFQDFPVEAPDWTFCCFLPPTSRSTNGCFRSTRQGRVSHASGIPP